MEVPSGIAPEHIFARVFREMRPRTAMPSIRVEYRRYANANAQIRLHDGKLLSNVISDGTRAAFHSLLCGHMKLSETLSQAVVREVR